MTKYKLTATTGKLIYCAN